MPVLPGQTASATSPAAMYFSPVFGMVFIVDPDKTLAAETDSNLV